MNISSINGVYNQGLQSSASLTKEIAQTNSFQEALEKAAQNNDDEQLKKACMEFESYFIQTMFKEMRKTVNKSDGIIPTSQGEEIFQEMLDEEYAKNAAQNSSVGLANIMFQQLKGQ